MAYRTTDVLVGGIIEWDAVGVPDMTPFIQTANYFVTKCCTDESYTDDDLELIERWLSAHFYAIRDPRTVHERAGSVWSSFQSKVDLGFDVTHYGQMAMRLDIKGGLAALNNSTKNRKSTTVGVMYLGDPCNRAVTDTDCCEPEV